MIDRRRFLQSSAASLLAAQPLASIAEVVAIPNARIALVIGNERYAQAPLRGAANDARGMAALLRKAGFTVTLAVDATREQMLRAIESLGKVLAASRTEIVLFYYAGHAAQLDWRNYLLPVDGEVQSAGDVRKQCVDLGSVLGQFSRFKRTAGVIILDACRDDPFGQRYRPQLKGLSQYDAPAGTLLAFATSPGRVAVELPGSKHGLYTEHLLRELAIPGVRLEDALKRVRLNVRLASRGAQIPWESTSLESDIYLLAARKLSAADLERQLREELTLWSKIKESQRIEDWVSYLRQFPNGRFAEVGQFRLSRLIGVGAERTPNSAPVSKSQALRLGPGIPVPNRLQRPANPNSAGSYAFQPTWSVGDEYVFQHLDLYSSVVQRTRTLIVRRVDATANRVEFSDGSITDLMGGAIRAEGRTFDPPLHFNPSELQVGKHWVSRFEQRGAIQGAGEYSLRIVERQSVRVPAGEFHAFKVDGSGWFNRAGSVVAIRVTRWMVPGINLPVRRERLQFGDARVLVSATQRVWNA